MKLYEFEGKKILEKHGVAVPPGFVIPSPAPDPAKAGFAQDDICLMSHLAATQALAN